MEQITGLLKCRGWGKCPFQGTATLLSLSTKDLRYCNWTLRAWQEARSKSLSSLPTGIKTLSSSSKRPLHIRRKASNFPFTSLVVLNRGGMLPRGVWVNLQGGSSITVLYTISLSWWFSGLLIVWDFFREQSIRYKNLLLYVRLPDDLQYWAKIEEFWVFPELRTFFFGGIRKF